MQRETDAVVIMTFRETNVNCGRTEINKSYIACFQLMDLLISLPLSFRTECLSNVMNSFL